MKFGKKKEKENLENIEKDKDKDKEKEIKEKEIKEKEIKEKEKKDKKSKDKKKNQEIEKDNINNINNNNNNNVKKVFGGSLPFLFEEELPTILVQTITYLQEFSLQTPGIFRENGSLASIQSYRSLYDNDKPVNFPPHEAHVVASLLKAYLRELKVPLCTFEHYDMFIACESIADEKVKVELLKKVIAHLPPFNRKVMKYIFSFLQKVVEHSNVNKMTPDALSIVFLPTILRPQANTDLEILQFTVEDSKSTKTLMSSILLNYDEIFEDPNLFQPRTRQARAQTDFVSPPSSQNSTSSSSYLSCKNPISPRSPMGSSPNFTTASILSALPPPPISPILSSNTTNTTLPPPLPIITSSIDDNNEPSLSPRIITTTPSLQPTTTTHRIPPSNPIPPTPISNNQSQLYPNLLPPPLSDPIIKSTTTPTLNSQSQSQLYPNLPPPLPDKNKCKLLPITTTTTTTNESNTLQPTTPTSANIPPLSMPPQIVGNSDSNPISPTKNQSQLPILPPKPPSLTLPPKPIPKIPTILEYENNVRQRSNTTMV
ncbi:hypothetical protein ACTFIY_007861 [Dictyostelium cf. discoideum]